MQRELYDHVFVPALIILENTLSYVCGPADTAAPAQTELSSSGES